jgi:hypothetical protein
MSFGYGLLRWNQTSDLGDKSGQIGFGKADTRCRTAVVFYVGRIVQVVRKRAAEI